MMAPRGGFHLHRPVLPPGATELNITGIWYHDTKINLSLTKSTMTWSAFAGGLCLFRPPSGDGPSSPLLRGGMPLVIQIDAFFANVSDTNELWGRLGPCDT